jgi:plasmid stabilization system protein ParE
LLEAQDWYEAETPGLGRRFRGEIDRTVRRITDNPLQFPLMFQALRRARVRKFPYGLFFTTTDDALIVVACFHASRDPRRWQERV